MEEVGIFLPEQKEVLLHNNLFLMILEKSEGNQSLVAIEYLVAFF